jgi:hypothetical protein
MHREDRLGHPVLLPDTCDLGCLFICKKRGVLMILSDQVVGVDAILRLPLVVTVGISFPLEEIFKLPLSSFESMINDGLHFVFVFSSDQFGWRPDEVWAV